MRRGHRNKLHAPAGTHISASNRAVDSESGWADHAHIIERTFEPDPTSRTAGKRDGAHSRRPFDPDSGPSTGVQPRQNRAKMAKAYTFGIEIPSTRCGWAGSGASQPCPVPTRIGSRMRSESISRDLPSHAKPGPCTKAAGAPSAHPQGRRTKNAPKRAGADKGGRRQSTQNGSASKWPWRILNLPLAARPRLRHIRAYGAVAEWLKAAVC